MRAHTNTTRSRPRREGPHVVLALVVCALVTGRPAGAQVTFKSGVDLVRLDVRVFDSTGKPITDLRPEEIVPTADGPTREVVDLRARATRPGAAEGRVIDDR